ncbi:hypothetical protein CCHR01_03965 [Colletotrichum chrysophilum]|uniref:Uncharacterized protein n=1 Tax=Colletotrichum chrysophilum TaxID=1836956 RepID=A0AAD9EIX8_9PEZI|nr:hypothetical protein CCHR01_03965 [Colletotrichum chrysophilum]
MIRSGYLFASYLAQDAGITKLATCGKSKGSTNINTIQSIKGAGLLSHLYQDTIARSLR